MLLNKLLPALLLFAALNLSAQTTLPNVDVPVTSRNYYEICAQLDAYFAENTVLKRTPTAGTTNM